MSSEMKALSYINGKWISEHCEPAAVFNPYTAEQIGTQYVATEELAEEAIEAAFQAKKSIAAIPAHKRAAILKQAALTLKAEKEGFAQLISRELGKPLKNTRDEVDRSIETLELSGEEAKRLFGETLPGDASKRGTDSIAMTFKVPVGVIGAITPFNAPLNLICHKIGPAFAAGNTVVLKPAPQTPLIAAELLKLLHRSGFPEQAIQMVLGGVEIGRQIVKDHRVNLISFTGSVKGGDNIARTAGMKKVLLELGGNGSTIVHHDADLKRAAVLCAKTGYSNSGQSCISVQRIYVHEQVVSEFVGLLKDEVTNVRIGDPLSIESDVGCLVDREAAKRVEAWIKEAADLGAEIVCGGERRGATIVPAVLLSPPKQAKVVCEEVFGPVVSIIPYRDIDEAVKETNDSPYGLQAGLFTNQFDLVQKLVRDLEVGGVVLNGTSNFRLDHWPYGGIKNSGIGREGPRFAAEEMTETKMVVIQQLTKSLS
ncbi:aldehyde dehydrogenase family protein [Bacillus atrophaeus]|uniref:aldehyde dehydrogenase family protein n=1 Tax=Bacillus atrophaeus TaxID=1452 RepID=UPI00227D9F6C|nr:aldehyde dehydrogenase family protein [Bacillus atrophaeus]MCY8515602.1 aldehyde dehydrogenase family protein [Bacillus atrophaeus]MCY8992839.1 aldehyde dehydrogenase family protein [Bacillus atrophaeus]